MKNFIFVLGMFFITASSLEAAARELLFIKCSKTYVHPSQIAFVERDIFVEVDDDLVLPVAAINTDAEGLYFDLLAVQADPSIMPVGWVWDLVTPWWCEKCGYWNKPMRLTCKRCGRDRLPSGSEKDKTDKETDKE